MAHSSPFHPFSTIGILIDHPINSSFSCVPSDDISVMGSNCNSCGSSGSSIGGVDVEFSLGAGTHTLTSGSLRIRALPDDGYSVLVKVYAKSTNQKVGECTIHPQGQTYAECTANLNLTGLTTTSPLKLYTESSKPSIYLDYFIYDFVQLNVEFTTQ